MRLVLYTGKGGVGKTTTAAATALRAAQAGRRTLLVSADAAHSLSDVLGQRIGSEVQAVAPEFDAIEVDARVELQRHWGKVHEFLVSLFRHQGIEGVIAEELALLPGAEEIATLIAVDEFARSGAYDFAVVDCAPTDTTLRLLTLPEVAHSSVRLLLKMQRSLARVVTPLARGMVETPLPDTEVFGQAETLLYTRLASLRELIAAKETSVRLVVTSERLVIDEARRAFTDLCLFGLHCDAVVMNRMLPAEAGREEFFAEWAKLQEERFAEVERAFAPLRVLRAELGDDEVVGPERLADHAAQTFGDQHPDAVLSEMPAIRFGKEEGLGFVEIPLPGAKLGALDIAKIEDNLLIKTANASRSLALPHTLAGLEVCEARLGKGVLSVYFDASGEAG
ncbi:MAG: TRC40/GET3/ArsA family transport-energizing ATPase [Myxococcota bacterium]|jgi:arsenite-transporting ATPase|nr:TRC40/GET3/ArsA family transport-energizing ATPase [Myxococcota bacterium]